MKVVKIISWFLGVSMFMVGTLKFFNPFKGWYAAQISGSELGDMAYAMGILGEIFTGLALIVVLISMQRLSTSLFSSVVVGASLLVVAMMFTGIYVHLHPSVPGDVLPLKIKVPFIPGFFLMLGLINAGLMIKERKTFLLEN